MPDSPLMMFHIDMNFVCLKPEYIRKWLKTLADLGYNAVVWELEDKVRWETCPECVWPEAMSKNEFKDILEYSRELGLEPIPLLQTIGHAEYVLLQEKYHSFRELPDHHDCYCTSSPEVREFLKTWIAEYLDLFGEIRYFHLGGDEAYVFGSCPECKTYAQTHSRNKLYAEHIKDISEPIFKAGARPGIWCDMILHYPENVSEIPNEFLIWDWNYWSNGEDTSQARIWGEGNVTADTLTDRHRERFPEIIDGDGKLNPFYTSDMLKRLGFDVVLCSAARSAGDTAFLPRHELHIKNTVSAAQKAMNAGLLGTLVTNWAIRLNIFETQVLTITAAPEGLNHPADRLDDIISSVSRRFTDKGDKLHKACTLLSTYVPFCASGSCAIQWNGLKDSLPAPPSFMKELIDTWKTQENPAWKDRKKELVDAHRDIEEGVRILEEAAAGFQTEYREYADILIQAGRLLERHAKAFLPLFTEGPAQVDVSELESLKQDLAALFVIAETEKSAMKNAGLIYDPLITYVSDVQQNQG